MKVIKYILFTSLLWILLFLIDPKINSSNLAFFLLLIGVFLYVKIESWMNLIVELLMEIIALIKRQTD